MTRAVHHSVIPAQAVLPSPEHRSQPPLDTRLRGNDSSLTRELKKKSKRPNPDRSRAPRYTR